MGGNDLRIVSLLASATEIVAALGLADRLVGRSHECDFPPAVKGLPVCTAPKFDIRGLSGDIDRRVREIVKEALSVYRVDANLLEALEPTHVLTQTQCEVCAVSLRDVEAALAEIMGADPAVVALEPHALADVWTDISRVGEALGVPDRAEALVGDLKGRMDAVAATAREREPKPTVAGIEWIDPLMATGNWMPELIETAGGVNLFGQAGTHSPWMEWDEVVAKDPDVLFVVPCGFDIPRTLEDMPLLEGKPGWDDLRAVRSGRVVVADGNQYFNRPGPRLMESLEILAEVLHPEAFNYGHRGTGWVPYPSG